MTIIAVSLLSKQQPSLFAMYIAIKVAVVGKQKEINNIFSWEHLSEALAIITFVSLIWDSTTSIK